MRFDLVLKEVLVISLFLLAQIFLNLIDQKLSGKKYSTVINVFLGVISLIFLFVPTQPVGVVPLTNKYDLYLIIYYLLIRAVFNLIKMANQKDIEDLGLLELGFVFLFSLNSMEIKGLVIIGLTLFSLNKTKGRVSLKSYDLTCWVAVFGLGLGFDLINIPIITCCILMLIYFLFIEKNGDAKVKLLLLLSLLHSHKTLNNEIIYGIISVIILHDAFVLFSKSFSFDLLEKVKEIKVFDRLDVALRLRLPVYVKVPISDQTSTAINQNMNKGLKKFQTLDFENNVGTLILFGLIMSILAVSVLG